MPSEIKVRRRVPLWTVCPPLGVDIDWGHYLTRGLQICLVANSAYGVHHLNDLADVLGNGAMRFVFTTGGYSEEYNESRCYDWFEPWNTAQPYKIPYNLNRGMFYDGSPVNFLYQPVPYVQNPLQQPNWDLSKGFSVFCQGGSNYLGIAFAKGRTDNTTLSFLIKGTGGTTITFTVSDNGLDAGGNVKSISSAIVTASAATNWLCTYDMFGNMKLYSFGNLAASDTFAGTMYQNANSYWGVSSSGVWRVGPSPMTYMAVWNRCLTPGEALDTAYFAQIFKVSRKQTFEMVVPPSGGGGGGLGGNPDDDDPNDTKDETCQDVL